MNNGSFSFQRTFFFQGAARRLIELYNITLENDQNPEIADAFRKLVSDVCAESVGRSPSSSGPSKSYKRIRAFLRDPQELDLLFDKALGLPPTWDKNQTLLRINLCSLRALLGSNEFLKLLRGAEVLRRIQPLVLHVFGWLETEQFMRQEKLERYILGLTLDALADYLREDDEGGPDLAASGVLAPLKSHLPWKRWIPGLDPKETDAVTWILKTSVILVTGSTSKDLREIVADDVLGWTQGTMLWAAAAAVEKTDEKARASFDDLVLYCFVPLVVTLQSMSILPSTLANDLRKLEPARAVAQRMVADVRGPADKLMWAKTFLEGMSSLQTLSAAAPTSAFDSGSEDGAHAPLLAEWYEMTADDVTQALIDTRNPADVIGADGEFLGTRGGGKRPEKPLNWDLVVRELESGSEDAVRNLLPRLARFCAEARAAGKADVARRDMAPRACAEALLALLESGKCSGLWQEPGALGTFFLMLHVSLCPPRGWARGARDAERGTRELLHRRWGASNGLVAPASPGPVHASSLHGNRSLGGRLQRHVGRKAVCRG